jgi:hypothetical protein
MGAIVQDCHSHKTSGACNHFIRNFDKRHRIARNIALLERVTSHLRTSNTTNSIDTRYQQ